MSRKYIREKREEKKTKQTKTTRANPRENKSQLPYAFWAGSRCVRRVFYFLFYSLQSNDIPSKRYQTGKQYKYGEFQ